MEGVCKQDKTQEILTKIIVETWENEKFKEELLNTPMEAIKNLTGEKLHLKEGTRIIVTDQSDSNTFYFNLPPEPNLQNVELTEEQLEIVAGGSDTLGKLKKAAQIVKFLWDNL